MSAYATSSPSMLQIRWYLIRPPSLACTCRNEMSLLSVAEYSLTGTLTRPNETAPFQMARMAKGCPARSTCATSYPSGTPYAATQECQDDWHAADAGDPGRPRAAGSRLDPRGEVGRH